MHQATPSSRKGRLMTPMVTDQRVRWPDGSTSLPPIDLVNGGPEELGGKDPRAPLTLGTLLVRGSLRVGHTFAAADPDAPIWMEERPVTPDSEWYRDFRCDWCVTKSNIAYQHGQTWMILEHRRGCRWLRKIAKKYPR